jgi:hypothetical protein
MCFAAQAMGNFPVLQVAYAGATGPIDAYKILATYYAATAAVVATVPLEGIYSAQTRSDLDSNTRHSVASLPSGFAIGTIPSALANSDNCGVRMRGFIRGPLAGSSVYTFTVALLVRDQDTMHGVWFLKAHAMQAATDRARAWVDNVSVKFIKLDSLMFTHSSRC